jgi:serine/threonine protein kinase/Tfp pilus assembly protein PilF
MPLPAGARLGAYEIVAPLGAGGMGEVYRARDVRLGRDIALKVLPEALARDADHLARFEREARTVASLNHPNIVTLHSVEDVDGIRFLTMELVEGQSLANLITPGGLPLDSALDMAIAIADALMAAHEQRVVHRDLKPANVMVTRAGWVKVLDFGLAKPVREATQVDTQGMTVEALSTRGLVVGTAPYMAPEQILGGAVDARTDLFAFGVLLYELLAGRRPFTAPTPMATIAAIFNQAPEPLGRLRADLPPGVGRIVSHCLEKDPSERPQTALALSNELRRLRRGEEPGEVEKHSSDKIASIAVLPFVNRSASADDDYFSDGLADELIGMLARIHGLRVSARASSFRFKGKDTPLAEVGRALNVATLVDGSVRKAGDRVRISVQLIKASNCDHLWSETYDRKCDDIFAVQDDIAQSVVKELRATLLGAQADAKASGELKAEVSKAAKGRATNPEAHRLYLQARHLAERLNRQDLAKAIEYLEQALELDPEFALAWAELSKAHSKVAYLGGGVSEADGHARARAAAGRALALEPDLAEGHAAMAWTQMTYDWDWRGAEISLRRALELAPSNALVLRWAGLLAHSQDRREDAIALNRRALEQDPLSAASYHNLAIDLYALGRLAESEQAFRKALELEPQMTSAHCLLSMTLLAQGRGEEALEHAAKEPNEALRLFALSIIHHALHRHADSDATLRKLIDDYGGSFAFMIAAVYATRGEADSTFKWLDRAFAQRDGRLTSVKGNPYFRCVYGDPRWNAFLRKMGLEDARGSRAS